nr:uncharacterized protein LOC109733995 [Aegilops tauschii subsp. strangulata]
MTLQEGKRHPKASPSSFLSAQGFRLKHPQPGRLRRCLRLIPATQDHPIPMLVTASVPARSSKKLRRHGRSPRASAQKGVRATLAATSTQPPTTGHTSPPPPHHAPPAASTADPPAVATENRHPSKLLPQERPDLDAMKPHRPSRADHLRHHAVRATTPHRPTSPPRHHPPDTATGSTGRASEPLLKGSQIWAWSSPRLMRLTRTTAAHATVPLAPPPSATCRATVGSGVVRARPSAGGRVRARGRRGAHKGSNRSEAGRGPNAASRATAGPDDGSSKVAAASAQQQAGEAAHGKRLDTRGASRRPRAGATSAGSRSRGRVTRAWGGRQSTRGSEVAQTRERRRTGADGEVRAVVTSYGDEKK